MKIKFFPFALFVLFFGYSLIYGQVTKDSYDRAVDYLNCKAIEESLKGTNQISVYKNKFSCDNKISSPDISKFLKDKKIDSSVLLSEQINSLKNTFDPKWTPDDAVKFLTEEVFSREFNEKSVENLDGQSNDKYDSLFKFADKRRDQFVNFQNELKPGLYNVFTTEPTSDGRTRQESTGNTNINPSPSPMVTPSNNESWIDLTTAMIFFPFLLSVISLVFTYYVFDKFTNEIYDLKLRIQNLEISTKNQAPVKTNSNVSDNLKSDFNNLSNDFNTLKSDVDNLKDKIASTQQRQIAKENQLDTGLRRDDSYRENQSMIRERRNEELHSDSRRNYGDSLSSQNTRAIFYFPTPSEDGNFNNKSIQHSFNDGNSIYQFTKISDNEAEFQIDERESAMNQAINYPEVNVERACVAENSRGIDKKRIVTVKPGRARLSGDVWQVIEKARIRYEH